MAFTYKELRKVMAIYFASGSMLREIEVDGEKDSHNLAGIVFLKRKLSKNRVSFDFTPS
jgi:hypothetical protein